MSGALIILLTDQGLGTLAIIATTLQSKPRVAMVGALHGPGREWPATRHDHRLTPHLWHSFKMSNDKAFVGLDLFGWRLACTVGDTRMHQPG